MNVAIVYHFFPHYRAAVMRELLGSTKHHYVLVGDERSPEPEIRSWPVEDTGRFINTPCRRLVGPLLLQSGLLKVALNRKLDTIIYHGNPWLVSTWISAMAARLTGKRVLFWTHGWTRDEHGPKAWLRKLYYKLPHALLLYGHWAKAAGLARGFAPEQLHVIYNSLDARQQRELRSSVSLDELNKQRRELFPRPELPLVVCCARLSRECRHDLLLKAQASLRDAGHVFNLLLIGDGTERLSLERRAVAEQLPVVFTGACYDEPRLARWIMAADVTVSPGKVGLTAMQSLAYGTPVITHGDWDAQGPECEAILPGRTGDYFRRNDVTDLMRAIARWTTNAPPRAQTTAECHRVIDRFYNPSFQRLAIERAVDGAPADDLFWLRERAPSLEVIDSLPVQTHCTTLLT